MNIYVYHENVLLEQIACNFRDKSTFTTFLKMSSRGVFLDLRHKAFGLLAPAGQRVAAVKFRQ